MPEDPKNDGNDWKNGIPEEMRGHPAIGSYPNENLVSVPLKLLNSHLEQQKFLGMEKVPVPRDDTDEKAWNLVYKALGRPDAPEEYRITRAADLPEDFNFGEKIEKEFKTAAHKNGLSTRQTNELFNWLALSQVAQIKQEQEEERAATALAETKLRQDWGLRYEDNMGRARALAKKYGAKYNVEKELKLAGLDNNPNILRMFSDIGNDIGNDKLEIGESAGGALTMKEAQAEMNRIYNDSNHPYHHGGKEGHDEAVAHMMYLSKVLSGRP